MHARTSRVQNSVHVLSCQLLSDQGILTEGEGSVQSASCTN